MIAELKPYPAIKDSGIPWLGKVPEHWELHRFKTLFSERVQKGFPSEPLLAATQTKGVVQKGDYENRTVTAQKDLHLLKLVEVGDFVISLRSFQGGIEISHTRGIISPAYTVLTPIAVEVGPFVRWLFKSAPLIHGLRLSVTGIREGQNIDYSRLSRDSLAIPSLPEQAAIVRFIEYVDRQIRRYIRAKQKLIKLLEEQKQAIIHQAVTGQIDVRTGKPYPAYKPSGVEWLGDVPEHWKVLRTKHVFREVDTGSTTGEETHLSMSQKLGLVPSDMVQSTLKSESYIGGKLCEAEDLVLNRLKAHLGVFALAKQAGVISPDYSVFRKKRPISTTYFELVLRSPACRRELRIRAKGIVEGFWRLYTDDFYDIRVPVPPVPEQDLIIAELDEASTGINTAIARANRETELLGEYRTRLIADVVTGKLDVRGYNVVEQSDTTPEGG